MAPRNFKKVVGQFAPQFSGNSTEIIPPYVGIFCYIRILIQNGGNDWLVGLSRLIWYILLIDSLGKYSTVIGYLLFTYCSGTQYDQFGRLIVF